MTANHRAVGMQPHFVVMRLTGLTALFVASASLLEIYIDETEKRTWFLFEASRKADATGH